MKILLTTFVATSLLLSVNAVACSGHKHRQNATPTKPVVKTVVKSKVG
ncbi:MULTISPECIES: hypothetical protein [unclassified Moraxella]